jgi:cysteine desulfurase
MIYLDNNATTALDPLVRKEMEREFALTPLNPSSFHRQGQLAKSLLLSARSSIAQFFGIPHNHLLFTSTATEGLIWLIDHFSKNGAPIISTSIEHAAIYEPLKRLSQTITFLPTGEKGHIELIDLEEAITHETGLIILAAVNSETGVKNPIKEIAALTHRRGIPLVIDGVALLGKEDVILYEGISAAVFSAHKVHGPKGVGCIAMPKLIKLNPLFLGGGQEYGLRSGTENLAGIMGFAKALEILGKNLPLFSSHMKTLQETFEKAILGALPGSCINGSGPRTVNVSNIYFPDLDAETLLIALDQKGICASHGSACSSGSLEPSRVLLQMGVSRIKAKHSVRFSLSRFTTELEIKEAIKLIISCF